MVLGSALLAGAVAWQVMRSPARAGQVMVSGSWYWAQQPDPLPQPIGTVPVPHPDVPGNDVAVSMLNGMADKVTYLGLDFSALPAGSTVSQAVLKLSEDPGGASLNQTAAKILIQPSKGFVASGSSGAPISQAPGADGGGPTAKGVRDAKGTWTFDVTAVLAAEVGGAKPANGLAVIPDPNSDNFQIVWKQASAAVLDVTATPPAPAVTEAVTTAVSELTTPPASDLGGSLGAPLAPLPSDTTPSSVAVPSTQQLAAAPAPTRVRLTRHGRPGLTAPFGLAFAGIVVLALGTGAVLGERGEPVERRPGSVLRRIEHGPLEQGPLESE